MSRGELGCGNFELEDEEMEMGDLALGERMRCDSAFVGESRTITCYGIGAVVD